jgi:hypothetical protein
MPLTPETPDTGKPVREGGALAVFLGLVLFAALGAMIVGAFGAIWFDDGIWLRTLLSGCLAFALVIVALIFTA